MVVVADGAADRTVQVEGPQSVRVLVDQGPLDQAPGRRLLGKARSTRGQVEVEGVQQRNAAQQVTFLWGEVGEGPGEERGEAAVEVGGGGGVAGAPDLQEAGDGEVEVEGQAVGAGGDRGPDVGADEGLAVLDQAAGEVGLAVLGGEVADQILPGAGAGCPWLRNRQGRGGGQARPGGRTCPVELAVQRGVRPRQTAAAADDEEDVRHEPDQALQQPLEVPVAVRSVLEGVQQDHRRESLLRGQLVQVPGKQVRVVGQRLQAGGGLQQGRRPGGAGQGLGTFLTFAQRLDERRGELSGRRADQPRQRQGSGHFPHPGLQLSGQHVRELPGQPGAPDVLVQRLTGVHVLPVVPQSHVEGRHRPTKSLGEREADRQDHALEVRAGRRRPGKVDPDGQHPVRPGGCAPLLGAVLGSGERCLDLAEQGRLPDAAHPVEDDQIATGGFEVLHVEGPVGDVAQVFLERGGHQGPLAVPVGERLRDVERRRVVGAEQRTQVVGHGPPHR
ncbi:hypothetical protein OG520_44245 (plasmid) [Streptomyces sp. NBC_00984]|uniref:hypothetical protein n=1 Tax=Streptomyces sp. NBC_00984 TaxID=2903700 RepID=UPI00386E0F48|nr:hypothetical protein OG520_44245 [Streptomyces sp. NBC_00984]